MVRRKGGFHALLKEMKLDIARSESSTQRPDAMVMSKFVSCAVARKNEMQSSLKNNTP